jgi:tetratricopeptide (TPR) repeat protein
MRRASLFTICVVVSLCGLADAAQDTSANAAINDHAERARTALARNDLKAAEQEYRAILGLDPNNADAYGALGVALYASGDLPEAMRALSKALELDSGQQRAELFMALAESDLGQCDKALPVLSRHFPAEADAKLRRLAGLSLLNCELASADTGQAEQTVENLRHLYPTDSDVLYKAAELYTRLWNEVAGKLIEEHPESYRVNELAGEVFEAQGIDQRAIKEFRLALEKNPRLPQVHFRIGQLLLKQDNAQAKNGALDEFQQELAVDPRSAASENAIGDFYREEQKLDDAAQHYKRAVQLDPDFAQAHIGLAQARLAQHQPASARQELETATKLQPDSATGHYNLMLVYRSEGKLADASREMSVFQRLQQQNSQSFENRLHSLLNAKPSQEAAQK